ncbi:MAG: hypothetical protein ABSH40_01560 [Bryobacteraceae bacterium]|jgi:hypothetical protein
MTQYLREFDVRYNVREIDDQERAIVALKSTAGKRLMMNNPKGTLGAV